MLSSRNGSQTSTRQQMAGRLPCARIFVSFLNTYGRNGSLNLQKQKIRKSFVSWCKYSVKSLRSWNFPPSAGPNQLMIIGISSGGSHEVDPSHTDRLRTGSVRMCVGSRQTFRPSSMCSHAICPDLSVRDAPSPCALGFLFKQAPDPSLEAGSYGLDRDRSVQSDDGQFLVLHQSTRLHMGLDPFAKGNLLCDSILYAL